MNIIPNKDYNTKNVNGTELIGAKVIKTFETKIERFRSKTMGVISRLYILDMNITYIWLSVDDIDDVDNSLIHRVALNGMVSQKAIKQYLKSYLLDNDIRITENSLVSSEINIDKGLDTVVEFVDYQGNLMITFFDSWFDIAIMTMEVKLNSGLKRFDLLQSFVYGGDYFGDDKLIELFGQIEFDMKYQRLNASYIIRPLQY